jgi:hypothetical protein
MSAEVRSDMLDVRFTMYVKQCVCLKNYLCMLYDPGSLGRPWAQFWTTIGPTVDLSKSASRTRKKRSQKTNQLSG